MRLLSPKSRECKHIREEKTQYRREQQRGECQEAQTHIPCRSRDQAHENEEGETEQQVPETDRNICAERPKHDWLWFEQRLAERPVVDGVGKRMVLVGDCHQLNRQERDIVRSNPGITGERNRPDGEADQWSHGLVYH